MIDAATFFITVFIVYYLYKYLHQNIIIKTEREKNPILEGKILCCPSVLKNSFRLVEISEICGKGCGKNDNVKNCKPCERCVTFEIKFNFKECVNSRTIYSGNSVDYSKFVAIGSIICGEPSSSNPIRTFPIFSNNFGYGIITRKVCLPVMEKHNIVFKLANCYSYSKNSMSTSFINSSANNLHKINSSSGTILKHYLHVDLTNKKYDCGCCCPYIGFKVTTWNKCKPPADHKKIANLSLNLSRRIGCKWLLANLYINYSGGTGDWSILTSAMLGPTGSTHPTKSISKNVATKCLTSGKSYSIKLDIYNFDAKCPDNPEKTTIYKLTPPVI